MRATQVRKFLIILGIVPLCYLLKRPVLVCLFFIVWYGLDPLGWVIDTAGLFPIPFVGALSAVLIGSIVLLERLFPHFGKVSIYTFALLITVCIAVAVSGLVMVLTGQALHTP